MTTTKPASDTTLSESNYREFAKRAIAAYERKDMLIDAILWSQIIGYYEAALRAVAK